MDFISILATVILFTTIATVVVGVAVYGAYKLRDRRKRDRQAPALKAGEIDLIFLEPYSPEAMASETAQDRAAP
jgi:heme/copper-type cytochrome/quinol oxidase subunit 2